MAVSQLTTDNIEQVIEDNDIVIIDFWAPWCGPCQTFKPLFEAASESHSDVAFTSCNTEDQGELAALFQVRSIPTVVVFRERIPVFSQPGMLPREALDDLLSKVRALDMVEVRATVERERQNAGGTVAANA